VTRVSDRSVIRILQWDTGLCFYITSGVDDWVGFRVGVEDLVFVCSYLSPGRMSVEHYGSRIFPETTRPWVEVIGGLCD